MSDIDTEVVDSLKVLDPDGRLEKRPKALQQTTFLLDPVVGVKEGSGASETMAVAPNGVAHAQHEIRCCTGPRSTNAHSR